MEINIGTGAYLKRLYFYSERGVESWIFNVSYVFNQCCGAGPFLTGSGYFFFTGYGSDSSSYKKKALNYLNKIFNHIPTSLLEN